MVVGFPLTMDWSDFITLIPNSESGDSASLIGSAAKSCNKFLFPGVLFGGHRGRFGVACRCTLPRSNVSFFWTVAGVCLGGNKQLSVSGGRFAFDPFIGLKPASESIGLTSESSVIFRFSHVTTLMVLRNVSESNLARFPPGVWNAERLVPPKFARFGVPTGSFILDGEG